MLSSSSRESQPGREHLCPKRHLGSNRKRHIRWMQNSGAISALDEWVSLGGRRIEHLCISIELVSRVTSHKGVSLTEWHPDPYIGPQVYLGLIKVFFSHQTKQPCPPGFRWWSFLSFVRTLNLSEQNPTLAFILTHHCTLPEVYIQ